MELLILPFIAALITFFTNKKSAKIIAVMASVFQLLMTGLYFFKFDNNGNYNFVETISWLPSLGISFKIGVDAISLIMILLTNIVVFLTVFMPFIPIISLTMYSVVFDFGIGDGWALDII